VYEALAAIHTLQVALRDHVQGDGHNLVIGIDNTAAAGAIRRGFSTNLIVNNALKKLYAELRSRRSIVTVVGLPTDDNAADPDSRGVQLGSKLIKRCWTSMMLSLAGRREAQAVVTPFVGVRAAHGMRHAEGDDADDREAQDALYEMYDPDPECAV
jgi:hypothetical protein